MLVNRYKTGFLIGLLCVGLIAANTTEFKTELSAFFVTADNAEQLVLASEMQSGTLSRRYLLSIDAGQDNAVKQQFAQRLLQQFRQIKGVEDVWSPNQDRIDLDAIRTLYVPHSAQLFSRHPQADLASLFSQQGLQNRAAMLKKALLAPQSALVKKIVQHDPLLLSLQGFKSLANQGKQVLKQHKRYHNFILQTKMSGLSVLAQLELQQALKETFSQFVANEAMDYQLAMTGVPVFAATTQGLITEDITRISILSSVALSLLFLWIFRSLSALFWIAALLMAVVSVAVLVTNLFFGYVHGMTMAIGTTLIGICIDYPIHGLVHAQTVKVSRRRQVIAKIWPSMVLGGLTTIIGYLALGFSGYPGFQQVAVYAGSGILTSLFLTRFLLPELLSAHSNNGMQIFLVSYWMRTCVRFRPLLVLSLIILSAVALFSMKSLHWIEDIQQLTPELEQLKARDKEIRARMISSIEPGRFILVSAENTEAALQKAERVYERLDQLKQQNALTEYYGLYPWLVSQQQQDLNQQLLHDQLTSQNQQLWQQALAKHGLSISHLGKLQYPQQAPLSVDQVLASPVQRIIDSQIIITDQQALVMIWIAQHDPQVLKSAFDDIDDVQYFSQRDLLNSMAADYRERAQLSLGIGLAVIILLLWLRYQRLFISLQTLLPAVIAALFILAGWSLSGQAISFLHLVGILLAVAICVDYGIFYYENRAANIELTYQAMAASMLTSALAFGCLAFADTAVLQTLAQVVASGVILGFLLCPVIIKPMQRSG